MSLFSQDIQKNNPARFTTDQNGGEGWEGIQPTNPQIPNQPTPKHTTKKNPNPQITSAHLQRNPKQTNKQKLCSTKSQNVINEDNLCGIYFLKIYLGTHSRIIKCLHLDQIQSFPWETELKYICDKNAITAQIMILLHGLQTFKSSSKT